MDESVRTINHNKKGRFVKGNKANPKGNNQFTSLVPLIEALNKSGKKYKQDFWEFVADKVRTSDVVLNAILKKLLPDKLQGEGFNSGTKIILVYPKELKDTKEVVNERVENRT